MLFHRDVHLKSIVLHLPATPSIAMAYSCDLEESWLYRELLREGGIIYVAIDLRQ